MRLAIFIIFIAGTIAGYAYYDHRQANNPDNLVHIAMGAKVGAITNDAAYVLTRLTATPAQTEKTRHEYPTWIEKIVPGSTGQARLRYAVNKSLENADITDWKTAKAEDDYYIAFQLDSLPAGKRIYYKIEYRKDLDSRKQSSSLLSFKTAPSPDERVPVFFQATTCHWPDKMTDQTFRSMKEQNPDFLASTGDNVYLDKLGARDLKHAYEAVQYQFGTEAIVNYFADVGGYFQKDDHDFRFDDADNTVIGWWVGESRMIEGVSDVFTKRRIYKGGQEKWLYLDRNWLSPEEGRKQFTTTMPVGDKPYRTVSWGKGVQIWILEGRDFRSPNKMADGPDKTLWGVKQRAWLKETLLESDADFRIIISPTPIVGPDKLFKSDNHANVGGFMYEGRMFLDWIIEKDLAGNTVIIAGDRHWQYHSLYKGAVNEFAMGPTSEKHEHSVVRPEPNSGIIQPYARRESGFLSVRYSPEENGSLTFKHYNRQGKELNSITLLKPE